VLACCRAASTGYLVQSNSGDRRSWRWRAVSLLLLATSVPERCDASGACAAKAKSAMRRTRGAAASSLAALGITWALSAAADVT